MASSVLGALCPPGVHDLEVIETQALVFCRFAEGCDGIRSTTGSFLVGFVQSNPVVNPRGIGTELQATCLLDLCNVTAPIGELTLTGLQIVRCVARVQAAVFVLCDP